MLTAESRASVSAASLYPLQENPEVLIPNRLRELISDPSKIEALPLQIWLGRMDQEFQPSLAVLFTETDGLYQGGPIQDEGHYAYAKALNHYRSHALKKELISEQDRALMMLIAHDGFPPGAEVISYIQSTYLLRQGLGKSFYQNFESHVRELGFKYMCGENDRINLPFFRRIGRYQASEIKPECQANPLWLPCARGHRGISTVKFFDPDLEEQCVQPQFLRYQAESLPHILIPMQQLAS